MRPILIDTNAYAAFGQGEPSVIEVIQHAEILRISPIVLENYSVVLSMEIR